MTALNNVVLISIGVKIFKSVIKHAQLINEQT